MGFISDKIKIIRFNTRDIIINNRNIKRLENSSPSFISSDCTGGVLSHDLHLRFNSPTVNLFFMAKDYLKFIKKPQKYMDAPMIIIPDEKYSYPIASIDDIRLFLVHYKTVEEAQEMWDRRKKRINWNNTYYIFNDRNECNEDDIAEFDSLPFKNKVCFVHDKKISDKYNCAYYIKGKTNREFVDTMTAYRHKFDIVRNYDQFDFITWINAGMYS